MKDLESMSSWRTGLEEMEWSLERWWASLEPEVELSDMEESEGTGGQKKWRKRLRVKKKKPCHSIEINITFFVLEITRKVPEKKIRQGQEKKET